MFYLSNIQFETVGLRIMGPSIQLRAYFLLLCVCITSSLNGQSSIYDSIYTGGRWRTFMTYLPAGYSQSSKLPLLLAFHGGSPLGYESIQYQSRLNEKADTARFIVVYPEGVKIAGIRTFNAGGCCAPSTTLNIDDVGFVNSLLDYLFILRSVDTSRVYATGFSNGALLCYRLASQLTHRFAAIAPVAGDLVYSPWNPSRSIPIIAFHSYRDQNIKYYGGISIGASGFYFPPQDSILGVISQNYSCSVKKDTLFHDTTQYDHFKYSNCSCNALIEQYISYDGEHSWPGGLASSGTTVSNKFSATYLMWKFFQNYTLAGLYTLVDQKKEANYSYNLVQNFPNPFNPSTTISFSLPERTSINLSVYNILGQKTAELFNGEIAAGTHSIQWNAGNFVSGVYFYKLNTEKFSQTKKLFLLK